MELPELSPALQALAARLAKKHMIPKSDIVHPKVLVTNSDGTIDEFMTDKLRNSDDGHYVPYCMVGTDCGRVRKTAWGFECPTCGNKMNYDLSHYDGNINVVYDGSPPDPIIATQALAVPGEYWKFGRNPDSKKVAMHRLKHAERKAWNAKVEQRKAAKAAKKAQKG